MPNTVAYFDISIGGAPAGRIEFELFDDVAPKVSPPPAASTRTSTSVQEWQSRDGRRAGEC